MGYGKLLEHSGAREIVAKLDSIIWSN
jgi:hypothetical protein